MSRSRRIPVSVLCLVAAGLVSVLAGACAEDESSTELHPEGPPMIQQVMLTERYVSSDGMSATRPVIAFGRHPDADSNEQHAVPAAVARNQRLRIVIDELLVGNHLEEIQCNGRVDEDEFSRVPLGATPDDIARCAVVPDLLAESCKGKKAVCVRDDGVPVGILDATDSGGRPYKDGIADVTRMIAGVAGVRCGGPGSASPDPIDVEMNPRLSYWQPAGNQQRPIVDDGLRGLLSIGPAVVLVPAEDLPTGLPCTVVFAPSVVDKSGLRPCAPPAGDITADCTPGDTSAVTFQSEPLILRQQFPLDEALGVAPTASLVVRGNVALDPSVTVTSEPPATFTITASHALPEELTLTPTAPLGPATRYVVRVPLRDLHGQGPAEPIELAFTTGT
jgi:Bacterial Ig-like domain